jgi:hypothetical protein
MFNSKKKYRVSYIYGVRLVHFGLASNISSHSVNLPKLNGENLYDMLNGELGMYPDSIYRISIVFTSSDKSHNWVSESLEFKTASLFGEEFSDFYAEFYEFVKEHRDKIEIETGKDITDVGVIIYDADDGEDVNLISEFDKLEQLW